MVKAVQRTDQGLEWDIFFLHNANRFPGAPQAGVIGAIGALHAGDSYSAAEIIDSRRFDRRF